MDIKSTTIEKAMDMIAKALGWITEPAQRKRMAVAEAFAKKTLASAENEIAVEKAKANLKVSEHISAMIALPGIDRVELRGDEISISTEGKRLETLATSQLEQRFLERQNTQGVHKQANLEATLQKALAEIDFTAEVDAKQISATWLNKWVSYVEDIAEEDIQQIWAKVLAGEFRKENSISLRTMNVLASLSPKEAELFSKVAPYAFSYPNEDEYIGAFLFSKQLSNIHRKFNITPFDMSLLAECNLVQEGTKIWPREILANKGWELRTNGWLVRFKFSERLASIITFRYLTHVGTELRDCLSFKPISLEFLKELRIDFGSEIESIMYFNIEEALSQTHEDGWEPTWLDIDKN